LAFGVALAARRSEGAVEDLSFKSRIEKPLFIFSSERKASVGPFLWPSVWRWRPVVAPSFRVGILRDGGKFAASGRDVSVRERPVARLAAGQGVPLDVSVGPVQPPVLGVQEPLVFWELSVPLQRLEPGVVAESEPAPKEEQVQVLVQAAPPEQVQALLALLLAQPLALPRPPVPGQALRRVQQIPPVAVAASLSQPVRLAGTRVLPTGLRAAAGAALLRLRPHRVPGGTQKMEGQLPDQVAEPHPFSLE